MRLLRKGRKSALARASQTTAASGYKGERAGARRAGGLGQKAGRSGGGGTLAGGKGRGLRGVVEGNWAGLIQTLRGEDSVELDEAFGEGGLWFVVS